jgi:hypothetical protein
LTLDIKKPALGGFLTGLVVLFNQLPLVLVGFAGNLFHQFFCSPIEALLKNEEKSFFSSLETNNFLNNCIIIVVSLILL